MAATLPASTLPTVTTAEGGLIAMPSPNDGADVFGHLDVRAVMAGMPDCKGVELYLDDKRQGEAMTPLGGNKYTQSIETSLHDEGAHRLTVCAVDGDRQLLASASRVVYFRNIGNLHLMSVLPDPEFTRFDLVLRINALRVPLAADRFTVETRVRGERFTLPLQVEFLGDDFHGIPVTTLRAPIPADKRFADDTWWFVVTVKDNQGTVSAFASTLYVPPRG